MKRFGPRRLSLDTRPLDEAEPFGVYFFQSSMLRVLTREGIRPKKKSQPGRSSLLKVQPTDNPGPVGSSQLRGRSDARFLIDMHASIKAGAEWIMYTNDGCYGTDHIPITPQFLLVAFRFTPRGSEEIWSAHSAVAPATNTHTPTAFLPHSSSIGSALPLYGRLVRSPLMHSSVRGWLSPCTFNRNVLVLTISPEWVSKLPGMLGPL